MKKQDFIMGMPASIEIAGRAKEDDIDEIFDFFREVDERFSTYKKTSEIEKINRGEIKPENYSSAMKEILALAEKTKQETHGYFDIEFVGKIDPSAVVKGWAIFAAAEKLRKKGYQNFFVEIAGDAEIRGKKAGGESWSVGIENPFNRKEIVKVVGLSEVGIATSGTYLRGKHIFDPIKKKPADEIASITVIGPNVLEADLFATAAFAMGVKGAEFIEKLPGFEAYLITKDKKGVFTSGFEEFTK